MSQQRKRRPGSGGVDGTSTEAEFRTVEVPPTTALNSAIEAALEQKFGPCSSGCWCHACVHDGCDGHEDPITLRDGTRKGAR
jgi:hypothetical protein